MSGARWLALPVLLVAVPAMVLPQTRNATMGWWDNPVTSGLDLTDTQERQIRDVVHDYRNRLIDARAAVEKAENDLEDVFNETYVDQQHGNEVIDRLVAARSELTKAVSEMTLRLRAVLTAEQWQELQRRDRERSPGRGRRKGSSPDAVHPQVTGFR